MLEHVAVTRYVTPLREGGSLPAIVEADNLGTYVMKFRGAGQGPLALVAEIIAGELASVVLIGYEPVPRAAPGRRHGPIHARILRRPRRKAAPRLRP